MSQVKERNFKSKALYIYNITSHDDSALYKFSLNNKNNNNLSYNYSYNKTR